MRFQNGTKSKNIFGKTLECGSLCQNCQQKWKRLKETFEYGSQCQNGEKRRKRKRLKNLAMGFPMSKSQKNWESLKNLWPTKTSSPKLKKAEENLGMGFPISKSPKIIEKVDKYCNVILSADTWNGVTNAKLVKQWKSSKNIENCMKLYNLNKKQ